MGSRRGAGCYREGAVPGSCCSTYEGATYTRLRLTTLRSRIACSRRPPASRPGTFISALSMRRGHATCARTVPSAAMREKYFERRQIKEAIAFAEAGGIAVHPNFDTYHGPTIPGLRGGKPFPHLNRLPPRLQRGGPPPWPARRGGSPEKRR